MAAGRIPGAVANFLPHPLAAAVAHPAEGAVGTEGEGLRGPLQEGPGLLGPEAVQRLLGQVAHAVAVQHIEVAGVDAAVGFHDQLGLAGAKKAAGVAFPEGQQPHQVVEELDADVLVPGEGLVPAAPEGRVELRVPLGSQGVRTAVSFQGSQTGDELDILYLLLLQKLPDLLRVAGQLAGQDREHIVVHAVAVHAGLRIHDPGEGAFASGIGAAGVVVLAIAVGIFVLAKIIGKTEKGAFLFDVLALKMPVTGTLVQRTAVSRLTRTLGTLLSSGVPILQSLVIVRDTSGNRVISKAIQDVHDAVKDGEGVTKPLSQCWVFPPMVISMVEVGEETGALADMLTRVADTYDDEVDNAVAGMTAAIEPALIIVLALVVGTIVMAMFLPMIKIIQSVAGGA